MYEQDDSPPNDLFDGIDAAETWEYATDDELVFCPEGLELGKR